MKKVDMLIGKIYHISYGENTQVIGMVKSIETMKISFFNHLHYWNGYESFHQKGECVTSGIEEIREATKCEKHNYFKSALEKDAI